jgi:hypothetical protein
LHRTYVRLTLEGMTSNASKSDGEQWRTAIADEARRVHETALHASETQFEYAKRWRRADRWIGGLSSALAAIAGVGGLSDLLSATWAGTIAILAALTGSIAASLGAPKTKEKSAISANAYRALQQDVRMFLNLDLPSMQESDARERLQSLVDRIQELNKEADIPSAKAWGQAKANLDAGSQQFEADR